MRRENVREGGEIVFGLPCDTLRKYKKPNKITLCFSI